MSFHSTNQVAAVAEAIGSELMPDNAQYYHRFTIKSKSSSRVYVVSQKRGTDEWCCGCPGWIHYRKCKHLTDLLGRLNELRINGVLDPEVQQMLMGARTAYLDLEGPKVFTHKAEFTRTLDL